MTSKQEEKRTRVYNFYIANKNLGKKYTWHHFKKEKMAKSYVCSIKKTC